MASLVSGFVTLHKGINGKINLGTKIHFKNSCKYLHQTEGNIGKVVKVEGQLAKELPICSFCGIKTSVG